MLTLGWPSSSKTPRSSMPRTCAIVSLICSAFCVERLEIVAEELDDQRALHARHHLLDVVGDRLREVPDHARDLARARGSSTSISSSLVWNSAAPLLVVLEIDETFRVEKSGRVGAVVGPAELADGDRHLRELHENVARLLDDFVGAFVGRAGRQRAAHPERALVEVREELRADRAAEGEVEREREATPSATPTTSFRRFEAPVERAAGSSRTPAP